MALISEPHFRAKTEFCKRLTVTLFKRRCSIAEEAYKRRNPVLHTQETNRSLSPLTSTEDLKIPYLRRSDAKQTVPEKSQSGNRSRKR